MSRTPLAQARRTAAEAAIIAYVAAKNPRSRRRDGGASILTPDQNLDLRDDLVDLVADVLIWARERAVGSDYILRVAADHAQPAHVAEDETVEDAAAVAGQRRVIADLQIEYRSDGMIPDSPEGFYYRWPGEAKWNGPWAEREIAQAEAEDEIEWNPVSPPA